MPVSVHPSVQTIRPLSSFSVSPSSAALRTHFPPHLWLGSDHLLYPSLFYPSTYYFLESFLHLIPSTLSCCFLLPPPSAGVPLRQLFCRCWLNAEGILEKCPKIWLVVRDVVESGLTFSTKCHRRQTNPRYRVEEIDQLFDIRWHTQVTHNIQISESTWLPTFTSLINSHEVSNRKNILRFYFYRFQHQGHLTDVYFLVFWMN